MNQEIDNLINYGVVYKMYPMDRSILDLTNIVCYLPHEILLKIYTEYFRPHKYAQLYKYLINSYTKQQVYTRRLFEMYLVYFIHHTTAILLTRQNTHFINRISYVKNNREQIKKCKPSKLTIKSCLMLSLYSSRFDFLHDIQKRQIIYPK